MFKKIWDQSNLPEKKVTIVTEKDYLLAVIKKYDNDSNCYSQLHYPQWHKGSEYGIEYAEDVSERPRAYKVFVQLAGDCSDEDIIRALFDRNEVDKIIECKFYPYSVFLKNPNLPADIIDKLFEKYPYCDYSIRKMQRVKYKYITEETKAKIDFRVAQWDAVKRKEKEEKTKQKLTAFLTTAAATKSVLTGSSIDDVVEQTITSDVDDAVLNYMNKLFDK